MASSVAGAQGDPEVLYEVERLHQVVGRRPPADVELVRRREIVDRDGLGGLPVRREPVRDRSDQPTVRVVTLDGAHGVVLSFRQSGSRIA
jgi:hypothetical protein